MSSQASLPYEILYAKITLAENAATAYFVSVHSFKSGVLEWLQATVTRIIFKCGVVDSRSTKPP